MKKKMNALLVVGIILIVAGVVCICAWKFVNYVKSNTMDGDGMVNPYTFEYASYYKGGGEMGEYYKLEICDGKVTMTDCDGNGCEEEVQTHKAGNEIYDAIEEVIRNYGISQWGTLETDEITVLDGTFQEIYIRMYDGNSYCYSTNQKLPEGGYGAFKELRALLEGVFEK